MLPGKFLIDVLDEVAIGTVRSEQCDRDTGLCSIRNGHWGRVGAKSGLDPARMNGVHLDLGVLEFRRQMNREDVDCGFGGVVSELPHLRERAGLACLKGQGTKDAGEVDDSTSLALLQQGKKLVSQGNQGEQVDV